MSTSNSGFRDFSPLASTHREFMRKKMAQIVEMYGYQRIETSAVENLSFLLGKYGNEGDALIYRIRQSEEKDAKYGLRYDMTLPLARYYARFRNELLMPFRRYQYGKVYRGDRPQANRYREFEQFDFDVIGVSDATVEAELLSIAHSIYHGLGITATFHINNRNLVKGIYIALFGDNWDKFNDFITLIDKSDKIQKTDILSSLLKMGAMSTPANSLVTLKDKQNIDIHSIEKLFENEYTRLGVNEIELVLDRLSWVFEYPLDIKTVIDPFMVRGLDYYTGCIFEAYSNIIEVSIGGGGRYDKLFLDNVNQDIPAAGFSIGFDRVFDISYTEEKYPPFKYTKVILVGVSEGMEKEAYQYTARLRYSGDYKVIVYPNKSRNPVKQIEYAEKIGAKYFVFFDAEQYSHDKLTIRNMESKEVEVYPTYRIPILR